MATRLGPRTAITLLAMALITGIAAFTLSGCGPEQVPVKPELVPAGEHDPAVWGEQFPEQYEQWLATRNERPAGKSAYKRGFDGGVMFDKLSEYPFMPLIFNGWGFGIDYNEPRGHYYMLIDQSEADPARVKSGGACLTCKSPYVQDLYETDKDALFAATYDEAVGMIPEEHQELGATCIDCHDTVDLSLQTRRWTAESALQEIGLDPEGLTLNQTRLMVCGQCHCTYSVMKADGKSVDVDFPWEGGEWGAITVEDIINNLETNPARLEWTQSVTGMRLGFIRHPDVEYFTAAGSPHANAGVTCSDCHMPDTTVGTKIVSDHNLMSPLKQDMKPCARCHTQTPEEMRAKVIAIQDASLTRFTEAGYRVATAAKLIEIANTSLETSSTVIKPRFDEAAGHYRQALYRLIYMGAENSVGFHNPVEGERILTDSMREADTAEKLLRELLAAEGVSVPKTVPLELEKYTENRGVKSLDFVREQYIADPTGAAEQKWAHSLDALLK